MRISCRNCRGIASLDADMELRGRGALVYASNGTFKTSLLKSLINYSEGIEQADLLHPERDSSFVIEDGGHSVPRECVHAILPPSELTACRFFDTAMLASPSLKERYHKASEALAMRRESLLSAIAPSLKAGRAVPKSEELIDFISACSPRGSFYDGLSGLVMAAGSSLDLCHLDNVAYQDVFAKTKRNIISKPEVSTQIEEYSRVLSTMLDDAHFLVEGFSYRNLRDVKDAVKDTKFFEAGHSLTLHDKVTGHEVRCDSFETLNALIDEELRRVFESEEVQSKFEAVSRAIGSSKAAQDLMAFLGNHPLLLARMSNPREVERDFYVRAILDNLVLAEETLESYESSKEELAQIRNAIDAETSEWERAIGIFKTRFAVPFDLEITNRVDVVLGDAVPSLLFRHEGEVVERESLFGCLSNGERNAMFLLHVIFEIERINWDDAGAQYLFFDDPVDSFDYKNKYGFVEYLRDFTEHETARVIVLTHNYDFLRTISSRLGNVFKRSDIFICEDEGGRRLCLRQVHYLNNNALVAWKDKIVSGNRIATIAAIPFVRELCEIKEGSSCAGYAMVSDVLHGRPEGARQNLSSLAGLFSTYLGVEPCIGDGPIQTLCLETCQDIVDENHLSDDSLLEGKVVLSMGIRILAERKLVALWNSECPGIEAPRKYGSLWKRIKEFGNSRLDALGVDHAKRDLFETVALITPANIHVNSFMYEPLIDTSEWRLVNLFQDCASL